VRGRMDVAIPHTRFTLANGLDVIVHEDHAIPVVSVNLWYRVGSGNEVAGGTGFAHLFEHLMFEGSKHVPSGEFDRLLEAVGGTNNGSTSTDRTNYWANVPSNALDLVLWLESDRMGYLLEMVGQEELDVQRDVVKNERRQSYENRPYGLAWETLTGNLYREGHPYHHPVIGSMADLDDASVEDVHRFFRTYYAPSNASLAIAGDVDVERVRASVERWFTDLPRGAPVPSVAAPPAALEKSLRLTMEDRVQLPRLYMAWHSPVHYTEEDAVLGVLSSVLAEGKASRLTRRLVYEEQLAQDVSSYQTGGTYGGAFEMVVTAKPGVGLARLESIVREELERVARDGVDGDEVERAIRGVEASFVHALQRVGGFGGKADRLNEYLVFTGDAGYVQRDLERYERVEPDAVAEAARRTLIEAPGVVLSVVPEGRRDLGAGEAA
jgi:zinc protease